MKQHLWQNRLPRCLSPQVDLVTNKLIYHVGLQEEDRECFFLDTNKTKYSFNKCLQDTSFIKKYRTNIIIPLLECLWLMYHVEQI